MRVLGRRACRAGNVRFVLRKHHICAIVLTSAFTSTNVDTNNFFTDIEGAKPSLRGAVCKKNSEIVGAGSGYI